MLIEIMMNPQDDDQDVDNQYHSANGDLIMGMGMGMHMNITIS